MTLRPRVRQAVRALPLAILAATTALSGWGLLATVVQEPLGAAAPAVDSPGVVAVEPSPVVQADAVATAANLRARPLFDRTRRPPPPVPPSVPPVVQRLPPPPPPVPVRPPLPTVLGIVTAGPRRVALVRSGAESQVRYLESGETAGGWRVVAILPHHVRFALGEDAQDQPLFPSRAGHATAAPPERLGPPPLPGPMTVGQR